MNLTIYKDAIATLAVGKLTAFLKTQTDIIEIEGWSAMRAPEKREQMLEAFHASKPFREQFVAFYGDETGNEADFSEWENVEAAPTKADLSPVEMEASETGEPTTTPIPIATTVFVEGAFEQVVSDVAGLDAAQSKVNLIEAEDKMEFEHVKIGALLSHIRDSQHYITLGYDNMREFIGAETGFDYRKATYLISNFSAVKELGIPAVELKGVTWSALRHVIPILTTQNYKHWLEAARSTNHITLIENVAKEKAQGQGALPPPDSPQGTKPSELFTKKFNVLPEQDITIKAALEKAKGQGNVESNGAALEIISAAYTGAPYSEATVAAVIPNLTVEGFKNMFSKLKADGGIEAVMPVLEALGEVWDEVDITVAFPKKTAA